MPPTEGGSEGFFRLEEPRRWGRSERWSPDPAAAEIPEKQHINPLILWALRPRMGKIDRASGTPDKLR